MSKGKKHIHFVVLIVALSFIVFNDLMKVRQQLYDKYGKILSKGKPISWNIKGKNFTFYTYRKIIRNNHENL